MDQFSPHLNSLQLKPEFEFTTTDVQFNIVVVKRIKCMFQSENGYNRKESTDSRVKSSKFGHQVNSDTHLQTV